MDFYNKHFYLLICRVDPKGMLNVPMNVYTHEQICLNKYFRTDKDFRKLDVPWMCEKLISLLNNLDEVSSNIEFMYNDFQRKKYSFILFTKAFTGLIIIQKNSINAYLRYCTSTMALYKNTSIALDKVPKKKKERKKSIAVNQSHHEEVIPKQKIFMSMHQDELDILLNQPTNTENAPEIILPEINIPHQTVSNAPIPQDRYTFSNLNIEENIHIMNIQSYSEQLQVIPFSSTDAFPLSDQNILLLPITNIKLPKLAEQSQINNNPQEQQIQGELIDPPKDTLYLHEEPKQMNIENQNNLANLRLKRNSSVIEAKKMNEKSSNLHESTERMLQQRIKSVENCVKRIRIEQNSKVRIKRMKTLEGDLFNRPLECMAMKYSRTTLDHLPLRHAMYDNKLNIFFVAETLNVELEKNKNVDDVFNNEITFSIFKANIEKLNYSNVSNISIYQQCINDSLPHLSLLSHAEEYSMNSLVWRNTINEINKKLEDSLKDISPMSKVDQNKWNEFKENMKQRVSQCHSLVPHNTSIDPKLSRIDVSLHLLKFPSPHQIDELLNVNTLSDICAMDQFQQNEFQNFQNNVESIKVYHKQSIDILQMITNSLQSFPEKPSCLVFTDLCPIHVTDRKYATLVFKELLGLHKKGLVKLIQPHDSIEPWLISIELNIAHF